MAGLLRLTHQVQDDLSLGEIEVGVYLHSALMSVRGHRVPHAARSELGKPHGELAGLQNIGVDELVDDALVGVFLAAAGALVGVLDGDEGGLAVLVRGSGDEVEARGLLLVAAAEHDGLRAAGDIQAVLKAELVLHAVGLYPACAAEVKDTGFTALKEEVRAEVCPDVDALVDRQSLVHGHDAENDHTVNMGVDSLHGIGLIKVLDKELFSQLLCGITLYIFGMC